MIPFNVPPCVGNELDYVKQAIDSHKICGDGAFTKQCNAWLEERFHAQKVLLTTSGTTALDMAMPLCDIHPGDEVILPAPYWVSYIELHLLQHRHRRCAGRGEARLCGHPPRYDEHRRDEDRAGHHR